MLNSTTVNCTIGLLGGIGPWAGLDVHQRIMQLSNHSIEQECVSIMHLSCPSKFSDRSEFLLGKTDVNPADAFVNELRMMEQSGVEVAAIICNTAHASPIIGKIRSQMLNSSLIYINIIDETQKRLRKDEMKKVGLLATRGTYQFGLYQQGFTGELILPKEEDRLRVHNCIYHADYGLKTNYPNITDFLYDELVEVGTRLIENGAEALVLGCTELPLLKELNDHFNVPIYNPNQVLAESLMTEAIAISTSKRKPQLKQNIS